MMSSKSDNVIDNSTNVDLEKRKFIGKCGKYAIVGAGMATLMTPTTSSAISSLNNGWGNYDQGCPGGSCPNNNAENNLNGNSQINFGDPTPN